MKPIPKRPLIPIVTDFLEYRQASDHTFDYARKMVERYGNVCYVPFTGIKNYFIHDTAVIREMLMTKAAHFKRTSFFAPSGSLSATVCLPATANYTNSSGG